MTDDPRCCGSGTCIIDEEGRCWCGQRWDGNRLVGPARVCLEGDKPASGDGVPDTRHGSAARDAS